QRVVARDQFDRAESTFEKVVLRLQPSVFAFAGKRPGSSDVPRPPPNARDALALESDAETFIRVPDVLAGCRRRASGPGCIETDSLSRAVDVRRIEENAAP